jgi:NAD(P)-dependent dehydrogenase (short-subunit alcohol dehydrogenase family)
MSQAPASWLVGGHAPVCLVIGAGDATGGAVARRFAKGGYAVCATRRDADSLNSLKAQIQADGEVCHAFGSDARDEAQVAQLVDHIEASVGPIRVLVFNIGANSPMPVADETERRFRKIWEMCCLAGFLNARAVGQRMLTRAHAHPSGGQAHVGSIVFTGATTSLRGGAGFAAFAAGKMALRAVAQSMAREWGPKGIHVAHTIIDGAIDTEFIRTQFPQRYALKAQGGILQPDDIAEQYWQLAHQPRTAWTHELDLRPYMEKF